MTNAEINEKINAEYMAYNNAVYSGMPSLPKDILETFKKAIFKSNPSEHKIPTEVIKKIINKNVSELTNTDVPIILNAISSMNFCDLYKDLKEALIKNGEIELLKISINITVAKINEQIEAKRNNYLSLSGGGNGRIKTLAQA